MKKQFLTMAAISAAIFFLYCQQANAQTWNQTGNVVTAASRLGSTNLAPVKFISNNLERMRLDSLGRFGVGTTFPTATFHVNGSFRLFNGTQGAGRILTSDANGLTTWATPPFWSLLGNAGTVAATNFIGTRDSVDFVVRTRNLERVRVTANGNVGIGTATPAAALTVGVNKFNVSRTDGDVIFTDPQGTIRFPATTGTNATMIQMFEAGTQNRNRMVIAHSAAYPTWGLQYQDTLDKFNFLSGGTPVLTADLGTLRVGVGTITPASKLHVVGDAGVTTPVVQVASSFVGTTDVRGIQVVSKAADGWGYGIQSTGGFIGAYCEASAGTYIGTGYGVYGISSGSAGTRIGVYGSASGGTDNNWGGYFPTKTYTSELRVGGLTGATGYVAAINGKLIATEVRVDLIANWPDYVFSKEYDLLSIEALEARINTDKHLPGVPSAAEMEKNGIMLGEMQTKTMEKLEETTLYIIQLNNKIKELEKKIEALTKKEN